MNWNEAGGKVIGLGIFTLTFHRIGDIQRNLLNFVLGSGDWALYERNVIDGIFN